MTTLFGRDWSRAELEARTGELAQIAGVTLVTLGDGAARGVRALIFRTGSGLEFWVLIDRAFDIAKLQFRGIELGWQSPVGIRAPWFHEVNDEGGAAFLRSFSGFMVTCGLDHTGAPHRESAGRFFAPDRQSIEQPLHGRIAALPGQLISYGHEWRDERCVLFCEGVVKQVAVFGEHLVLTRRIEAQVGESFLTIRDRVRNHSFYTTPHMLLYHLNLGFPLLESGAEFVAPTRSIRWSLRDSRAEHIGHRFQEGPHHDCVEQVYVHDAIEDADGKVRVALINRCLEGGNGVGVAVEFSRHQLPYLMQWQNFQEGSYCMAIEPATCHALGRPHAQSHGELTWLRHGEERLYDLRVAILSGPHAIADFESAVRKIAPEAADQFATPLEGFGASHSELASQRESGGGVAILGGVSSDIRLVAGVNGPEIVKRALGKLRVATDWYADCGRSRIEVRALQAAAVLLGPDVVPEVLWSKPQENAFAMRPVDSRLRNWKQELLAGRINERTARRAGEILGLLHARSRGAEHIEAEFSDLTHFRTLRITPFFSHVARKAGDLGPSIEAIAAGMGSRRGALVHGDYSPKNILADGSEVVILDFEVAHWGDPRFDLAFCLAHLLLKGLRRGADMPRFEAAGRAFLGGYGPQGAQIVDTHMVQLLGCLVLARIDGDSPVDYLQDLAIERARELAAQMIRRPGAAPLSYFRTAELAH